MPVMADHVVVLALENRSFDHLLGFAPHPDPAFDGLLAGGPHTAPPWTGGGPPIPATRTPSGPCPSTPTTPTTR